MALCPPLLSKLNNYFILVLIQIDNFLLPRSAMCSPPFLVSNGVPQGSTSGSLLFRLQMCTDDYLLYTRGRGAEDVATKLITVMEKAAVWVNYLCLYLSCCHV